MHRVSQKCLFIKGNLTKVKTNANHQKCRNLYKHIKGGEGEQLCNPAGAKTVARRDKFPDTELFIDLFTDLSYFAILLE